MHVFSTDLRLCAAALGCLAPICFLVMPFRRSGESSVTLPAKKGGSLCEYWQCCGANLPVGTSYISCDKKLTFEGL
jgi:hypothetical protein